MAKDKQKSESPIPAVADATTRLETATQKLDNARETLAGAEREYADACSTFDASVAQARKFCSR